jgi:WhiB family redox-sensing transcriptional regulator
MVVSVLHVEELWQDRAACRGPHTSLFFPPSHFERKDDKESRESQAKAICSSCPVKKPCLQYALRIHEPHGIWGGFNEIERRNLSPH